MSAPAVVIPTTAKGAPMPGEATAITPMKGGALALSPLPLKGGKRKGRGKSTKRISKKVLRMFKSGSKSKLMKLMKGGEEAEEAMSAPETPATGARRTRRKHRGIF